MQNEKPTNIERGKEIFVYKFERMQSMGIKWTMNCDGEKEVFFHQNEQTEKENYDEWQKERERGRKFK